MPALHRGRLDNWAGLRDKIWRRLWNLHDDNGTLVLQQDFLSRVQGYAPFAIVNACTSGLHTRVTTFLRRVGYTERLFETVHPSSWTQFTYGGAAAYRRRR